jgi:hypothetical protein
VDEPGLDEDLATHLTRALAPLDFALPERVEGELNPFIEWPAEHWLLRGGDQYRFEFGNGYGASVIRHHYSYGYDEGLWELGVMHHGALTYETPITCDVIGNMTDDDVRFTLKRIAELPAA